MVLKTSSVVPIAHVMRANIIHDVLRDHVNFLLTENPRVQFVVDDLEYWDEPVFSDGADGIPLRNIFHGIEQEGSDRYTVTSTFSHSRIRSQVHQERGSANLIGEQWLATKSAVWDLF